MFDLFGQLEEMKKKMEEMQSRLENITIDSESGGGAVTVVMTANRKLRSIDIREDLISGGDKEEIEDLVTVAVNRALTKAKEVEETEMKGIAGGLLPPGLGG